MLNTIRIIEIENVYKPREDTYITLRGIDVALSLEVLKNLKDKLLKICDVGSGTGILGLYITSKLIQNNIRNIDIISVDIDFKACICTLTNFKLNNLDVYVDVICCDLLECIKDTCKLHILISNPPYLPEDEYCDHTICAGPDGRGVIDRILMECFNRKVRMLILTQSSLSDIGKTIRILKSFKSDILIVGLIHILFEDIITILAINYIEKDLKNP